MPAISTTQSNRAQGQEAPRRRKKKVVVKPKPAPVKVRVPDANEATRYHRTRPVTPDQADRQRTPRRQAADKQAVAKNVKASRELGARNRKLGKAGARVDSTGHVQIIDPQKFRDAGTKQAMEGYAPVLHTLKETTRINHAIAGAADAAVQGRSVTRAASRGIQNKDETTFSDVLKHAGVKNKTVRGVAGFGLDVATDPTTYVTFGAGSVAAKSASKAAARAEKTALKKGLTKEQAARMGTRARTQTERKGNQAKGVTVKVAGKELPAVRKATAAAGKPARAAGRKVTPGRVREGARAVAADLNPDAAPVGVSKETSRKAVQATRTARAKTDQGVHEAQQGGLGIRKMLGEANYSRVIDAIETGTIGSLPPTLRDAAVRVRSQFRHANRQRKQAGIRGGEIKRRGQVKVPKVTADVAASAKDLGKARRAEAAAERAHRSAALRRGIYQGRAEILSRNVSGARAEKAAERGRDAKKSAKVTAAMGRTERRALAKGLTPMQATTAANRVAEALRATKYAAGAKGIRDVETEVDASRRRVDAARAARAATEAAHETTKLTAAAQRKAREVALETNARRAAAPVEYIPHQLTDEALETGGKTARRGAGRKVIRPSSSMARGDNRPLSKLREEKPGYYSEDLPALYASRKTEGATSVARAELNRRIAELGRTVKKGRDIVLDHGEGVYHITGSDIRKITDKKELARLAETGSHSGPMKGRYVVLNDDIVKRAVEGSQPTLQGPGIVRGLDRLQGGFKRLALATPGFHVRNIVGDTQNAYLGQPAHRLPRNMAQAGRVLKAQGRRDQALRGLNQATPRAGTVKTGRYGEVPYEQVAEQLSRHGGMRSGYTARELPELSGEKATLRRVRMPRRVKAALINREDLPRVTTALDALKKGATWEEAAQRVADYHFDYGHLTNFERQIARRGAPFYTFTARNIPRQFKSLATHPGKFANYQKFIESASKATGMNEEAQKHRDLARQLKQAGAKIPAGWEAMMSEWEQRNAGVPVSWKGHKFTVSFGLPLASGLNELPGAAGKHQLDEYFKTAMSLVTPVVKNPLEYFNNYSFFFRDQIQRDESPLVSAPSYVGRLPQSVRDDLGVVKGQDKKTGNAVWKWPGKVDYIVKTVPGLPQYAEQLMTEGTNRRGKGTGGKALQVFGVRAEPFDPPRTITNLAYARAKDIEKRQATLRQTLNPKNGLLISAKNPTAEYVKLSQQLKLAQNVAFQAQQRQQYKVLPKTGAPPQPRGSSGRVRIPGVSGRVTVPGVGGRVKIP
jgi:hypothetical protein